MARLADVWKWSREEPKIIKCEKCGEEFRGTWYWIDCPYCFARNPFLPSDRERDGEE